MKLASMRRKTVVIGDKVTMRQDSQATGSEELDTRRESTCYTESELVEKGEHSSFRA